MPATFEIRKRTDKVPKYRRGDSHRFTPFEVAINKDGETIVLPLVALKDRPFSGRADSALFLHVEKAKLPSTSLLKIHERYSSTTFRANDLSWSSVEFDPEVKEIMPQIAQAMKELGEKLAIKRAALPPGATTFLCPELQQNYFFAAKVTFRGRVAHLTVGRAAVGRMHEVPLEGSLAHDFHIDVAANSVWIGRKRDGAGRNKIYVTTGTLRETFEANAKNARALFSEEGWNYLLSRTLKNALVAA